MMSTLPGPGLDVPVQEPVERVTRRTLSPAAEAAMMILGFTALTLAATFPLVRHLATHLPADLGDSVMNTWLLAWDATRIRHGLSGLWDAPSFFPYRYTLAYSDHLLGIAIFTAPLQWLTGNPVLVHNIAFLASFVLSGAGMYLLARTLTLRRDAAVVAGLVYAFSPYRVSQLAHVQLLMAGWLPLSLWALNRYFSTGAWRFLLASAGGFLLQSLTAGYFLYFAVLPLTVAGLAEMRRTRPPLKRTIIQLGTVAALMLVAIAPIARVYYRVRHDYGLHRTMADIASLSANVRDYVSAPPRVWIWRHLGTDRAEHNLFPGAIALLLAFVALAARRRTAAVRTYAVIGLSAFVLSLGPEPAAWSHRLPFPGPYAWLLSIVPGLDGLRAVARLDIVVILALSVLAAFGLTWWLDWVGRRWRSAAFAAVVIAIVAEGWAAPIPTPAFAPLADHDEREAYEYLRDSPPGAALEMPLVIENDERNFAYQYLTLVHRHPIVNGHSGYLTPLLVFLGGGHSPFSEPDHLGDALAMLRSLGVRYLVVHLAEFADATSADALMRTVENQGELVAAQRRFGRTVVVTLAPGVPPTPPPPDLRRVQTSALHASASQSSARLQYLFDADPDSRWLSGDRQRGNEWIDLKLDHVRDVRLVRMQMASRSFGDYPRELAIDVVEDGGTRTLFRGSVLPQFVHGLVANGVYPTIDVVLPENHARALRLRQLATTNRFYWSIHGLDVWER